MWVVESVMIANVQSRGTMMNTDGLHCAANALGDEQDANFPESATIDIKHKTIPHPLTP